MKRTDFAHEYLCKLGAFVIFAAWTILHPTVTLTAFGNHITHIVKSRASENMVRADAGTCITAMEGQLSFRDGTVDQFKGKASRADSLSCVGIKHPIPAARAARPEPAAAQMRHVLRDRPILIDTFPKALFWCSPPALAATKLCLAIPDVTRISEKSNATSFAGDGYWLNPAAMTFRERIDKWHVGSSRESMMSGAAAGAQTPMRPNYYIPTGGL